MFETPRVARVEEDNTGIESKNLRVLEVFNPLDCMDPIPYHGLAGEERGRYIEPSVPGTLRQNTGGISPHQV